MDVVTIIIVGVCILVGSLLVQPAGTSKVLIAPELQGNAAAQEIAALGIPVTYEELGTNADGLTVNAQTWFYVNPAGKEVHVKVILDRGVDPNSYEAHASLYHELGHVLHSDDEDTEANADAYALSRGYSITDAYSGIY